MNGQRKGTIHKENFIQLKKGRNSDTCHNMDDFLGQYAK